MFYSRPDIKPLGWDLKEMPQQDGSRNHLAVTNDNKIVGFRFSSGWLHVRYSKPGGTEDFFQMEHELYKNPIAPFGITDIFPEQLCDILGLTVQGQKIEHPFEKLEKSKQGAATYIDLSGKTTHWDSSHLMLAYGHDDVDQFIDKIFEAFPDTALIQSKWDKAYKAMKRRQISFMIDSDERVMIGIGCNQKDVGSMVRSTDPNENIFPFYFSFTRHSDAMKGDPTRKKFIERFGAKEANLNYEVINHRRWNLITKFQTDDDFAQQSMKKLLAILDDHFCKNIQVVNIQTQKVLKDISDDRRPSYSKSFCDWCLEKPNRYLSVGYEGPQIETHGEKYCPSNKNDIFYGLRPVKKKSLLKNQSLFSHIKMPFSG